MPRKKRNMVANQAQTEATYPDHEGSEESGLAALAEAVTRVTIAKSLGQSYDGKRDIYGALGLPKKITPEMMIDLYERGGIFQRAAEIFPTATWREDPDVYEDSDPNNDTDFERQYKELLERLPVYAAFKKADVGMGLGRFSILVLGFNDGRKLREPVERATELTYIHPYREPHVEVDSWDEVETSPRLGKPLTYKIRPSVKGGRGSGIVVHFSRVIHLAERSLDNDTYADFSPLKAIYNYAFLLDMVTGGSAEAQWRGGFPGISFEADKDAKVDMSKEGVEERKKQFDEYAHGFRRILSLHGIKANTLAPNIKSPKDVYDVLVTLIAGTMGVPKRKFEGTERGELASSEDSTDMKERTQERRGQWAAPMVLKVFIRRLIEVGVLPTPKTFIAEWPKAQLLSESQRAVVAKDKSAALASYANSAGAQMIVPPRQFVEEVMDMKYRGGQANTELDEEDRQAREDEEEARRQAEEDDRDPGEGGN